MPTKPPAKTAEKDDEAKTRAIDGQRALPLPPILSRDLDGLGTPGVMVEVTREQAEAMGLCEDDAVSFEDAWEAAVNTPTEHQSVESARGRAAASPPPKPAAAKKPKTNRKKREPGEITRRTVTLAHRAAAIATHPPTGEDMAFTHAVLCMVGMPRAKVTGREFLRESGSAWVNIQAGYLDEGNGPVPQPVPYGVMPRLALAWVSTEAVRKREPEIRIGDSAAEFLRLVGIRDSTGRRYATLRQQMHALAAARLQLGFKGRTYNGQPVEQFDAWLSNRSAGQRPLWPGVMKLSEGYYHSLLEGAVPLDNRALMALSGSALALDVYMWLAHRLHRIEGRGIVLHWKSLREQFAQEYTGRNADKDFKKSFLPALRKVLAVYPQAKVKSVTGGVLLIGSPPPIPYKG